ncbi:MULTISPECIES: fibrobacter succinogenes major paralogous domain-containing protein [unclassified Fibrobacter]|uniref:fibrobacter succinogenes major paralogous domain-containing protein n=1 Tax=unclassified Fibrobacter TaxID=2634177 RepID=UPI0025B8F3FB|nr:MULTISPECIES: fibrobacter succinogenes major paralogous domain-containing protein [unclassified Fibrobacter]
MKKLQLIAAAIALLMTGCNEDAPFTMKDKAGNVYKTVMIGNQVWMAQNLNVETEESWCYFDNPANCEKYGRLYTWSAAKKACPEGWHLPDTTEWNVLIQTAGGGEIAGGKLKSTSGWDEDKGESGNGTDDFGFSALPAGSRGIYAGFTLKGGVASSWTSTGTSRYYAYSMCLNYNYATAKLGVSNKNYGFSVRCVKD